MALSLSLGVVFTAGSTLDSNAAAPASVSAVPAHPAAHPATSGVPHTLVSPVAARAAMAGTTVTARWTGAVDVRNRAAVNAAYWSRYANKLSLPIGWLGGSLLACLPGLSSALSNNATLSSLNYVRSLAGLAPVTFSPSLNASAQKAALMMDANNALDHYPSSGWKCYSQAGATAASRSNLALAWPTLSSGEIISLYMADQGSDNQAAGHRRWILYPFSTVMGSGSTNTANALTVIGPTNGGRPNPRYVAWPSRGYFPAPMEPDGRWSISSGLNNVSFGRAHVTVYHNGAVVPVTQYGTELGYGQPTLVWRMHFSGAKVGSYRVVVSGIRQSGVSQPLTYSYGVVLFTPTH
jgi:uncharacterized protein YkwD